ncbi:uncharacterized protein EAF01_007716 [Botrytis porri]|uniref:Ig-like domain-containing protein n=1 Tax=Botrytis porri TaxID=87229 RepID=A0A4Z1KHR1_9HELO|nr:uncharacterized protein EAF01_007716 [Botrytis porri]KAF7900414.1 hypothetical protein EAF01_007716 [Botrytis porri]TGO85060.1 hypothetical protein BPOR_0435g00030 [Botrytis porri]
MLLSVLIGATGLAVLVGSSQASTSHNPFPSNQTSIEFSEENQMLFSHYETITHLLSNLHGRIGINDDATPNLQLGREEPHYIDPKDLKLVPSHDLEEYNEADWVRINEQEIVLQCGSVNTMNTGKDWAFMQRCTNEEVAIRRLMATFNDEGHEFVVSISVLKNASTTREGTYRCIKDSCPKGPLALATPTSTAIISNRSVAASPVRNVFEEPTAKQSESGLQKPTKAASQTSDHLQAQITRKIARVTKSTSLMTITRASNLEDLSPKSPTEKEVIRAPTNQLPEPEDLPAGRWLAKRKEDPYITVPRPECRPPPDDFTLSGKIRTVTRNPRKTKYTTIEYWGYTSTSIIPPDPNRPPPRPSIVEPTWVTNSFFQTWSCRKVWMDYFNMDYVRKRDIVERVLEDLQAAARK